VLISAASHCAAIWGSACICLQENQSKMAHIGALQQASQKAVRHMQ
jgi:hypothetical protein